MSRYIKQLLIFIAMLPCLGYTADYTKSIADFVADCPAQLKASFPSLSAVQLEKSCTCVGKRIEAKLKEQNFAATQQQKFEMAREATKICGEPYAKEAIVQQCISNREMRHKLQTSIGLSNEQYDRYCGCHTNLVFDEVKRGLDPDNPQSQQVIGQKSINVCLKPIMTGAK